MAADSKRLVLILVCLVFFALGLMAASIGPALPDLAVNATVSLAFIGSLFTGIFLGALIAQIASGPVMDRLGQQRVLLTGVALMSLGTFLLTFSRTLPLTLALSFLAGLGHGAVDLAGNVWIARLFKERSVSALNVVNFFFGLGAVAGPAASSFSLRLWSSAIPALWLAAGILLFLIPLLTRARNPGPTIESEAGDAAPVQRSIYASPLLWALGFIVLVYVGIETGMGGWTTAYMQLAAQLPAETATLVTAGFWLALTAGRMISAALGLRVGSRELLAAGLLGSFFGGLLLLAGQGNALLSVAAVLWIGFCFGPVYPTLMSIITLMFQESPGKAAGVAASLGSVGGMLLPWLQGILLERSGPPASAALSTGGALVMVAVATLLFARLRSPKRIATATLEVP
jgi:fucose permease